MKKTRFIIAILLMVVATAVAFVSCKKDDQSALLDNTQPDKTFTVPQIDDMKAYLKEFKQKMQTSKEDESMPLEEAAWHLSCLANVDFCRINVECDDFLYDTIDMQVETRNGVMLMSDLNEAYEQMCAKIQQFKKGFKHPDQNLYFIKVSISTEGNAKIALKTSYTISSKDLYNHPWYYQDVYEAISVCDQYFNADSTYFWDGLGASELKRILNIYDHHENGPTVPGGPIAMCFIPTRNHNFNFTNTYDPYGSGFYYINESRVFAINITQSYCDYIFDGWEFCYLLDSYLGLGYDYINDNLYSHEFPVNWVVTPISEINYQAQKPYFYYHNLYVEYGRAFIVDEPTPND